MSRPGVIPFETGMVPLSWFSLKSNHERLAKLPSEGGIGPVKLLEFNDLHHEMISFKEKQLKGLNN